MELIERRLRGERLPIYRKNLNQHFPLRGDLLCEACSKPVMGSFCGGRSSEYGYYYCCQKSCELKNKSVRYEIVHSQFNELLNALKPSPELISLTEKVFSKVWKEEAEILGSFQKDGLQKIDALNASLEQCVDELLSTKSLQAKKLIQARIDRFSEERDALKVRLESLACKAEGFGPVLKSVKELISDPSSAWTDGDLQRKQLIQRLIFPEQLIYEYSAQKFRKPSKALVFSFIEKIQHQKEGLVGPEGLEPPTKPL